MHATNSENRKLAVQPFVPPVHAVADALDFPSWARVLVFAPHPDDESLGCGGLIRALCIRQIPVDVIVVTDGSQSHPNSRTHSQACLRDLRQKEVTAAVAQLGLGTEHLHFLNYGDSRLPASDEPGFSELQSTFRYIMESSAATMVVVPRATDPHCDHRAVHAGVRAAQATIERQVRVLEYPIWIDTDPLPAPDMQPVERMWYLDVRPYLSRKKAAISCHASQTTHLINDDPEGFMLTPDMLAAFQQPFEYYFEHQADSIQRA